ncbi:MAG: hypothetical protein KC766_13830 [Myxococcales bacterium]|nr:hypothetical protein [Myxococcales bacterium]
MWSSRLRAVCWTASCLLLGLVVAPGCSASDGGEESARGALGKACDASDDCPGDLFCNYDSSDYVAHRQCSSACSNTDQCKSEFGPDSFCVGAGVCVKACHSDSECPSKSRCGTSGWCEREGKGSGNPYCSGTPDPCDTLGHDDCARTLGCEPTGACAGAPPACPGFSQVPCENKPGCHWVYSNSSCAGTSLSCSTYTTETTCVAQTGCHFNGSCAGAPLVTRCEDEVAGLCEYTAGCTLVE